MIVHLMGDATVGGLKKALQEFNDEAPIGVYDQDTMVVHSVHSVKQEVGSSRVVIYT